MTLTKSQGKSLLTLVSSVFGVSGAYRDLRRARDKGDRLSLVHALLGFALVATGVAIAVRALRNPDWDV